MNGHASTCMIMHNDRAVAVMAIASMEENS